MFLSLHSYRVHRSDYEDVKRSIISYPCTHVECDEKIPQAVERELEVSIHALM